MNSINTNKISGRVLPCNFTDSSAVTMSVNYRYQKKKNLQCYQCQSFLFLVNVGHNKLVCHLVSSLSIYFLVNFKILHTELRERPSTQLLLLYKLISSNKYGCVCNGLAVNHLEATVTVTQSYCYCDLKTVYCYAVKHVAIFVTGNYLV